MGSGLQLLPQMKNPVARLRSISHVLQILGVLALFSVIAVPAASADTIHLSEDLTGLINVSSSNDNHWAFDVYDPSGSQSTHAPEAWGYATIPFPDLSLTVPAGSTITSALFTFDVPAVTGHGLEGTGYEIVESGHSIDPSLPSAPPSFSTSGTSFIDIDGITISHPAIINGDEVSSSLDNSGPLFYSGFIYSDSSTDGSNWEGYVGGAGQVDVPYSLDLDVTYTPEPSTFILLGTGILGLVEIARRRLHNA